MKHEITRGNNSVATLLLPLQITVKFITGDPIFRVYAEAATMAAKYHKNAVIIETQPDHGRDWCQLARTINPNASCRIALAHGESTDGYA